MKKNHRSGQIKQMVSEKYAAISKGVKDCANSDCCSTDYSIFADDYSGIKGYNSDADLGLGCGLPTEFAKIGSGDTVVDLGSGAGNDCFIARQLTGSSGHVIGIDLTEEMINKARKNAAKMNLENVEFILGDIEDMPLNSSIADVVVSNCVLNLVPDKKKAFSETFRILKKGGHFSISDVVTTGDLPNEIKRDAEMYAGCVAGAIDMDNYVEIVKKTGFSNITLQKLKEIQLPDEMLYNHMSAKGVKRFRSSETGIYSITIYAEKI